MLSQVAVAAAWYLGAYFCVYQELRYPRLDSSVTRVAAAPAVTRQVVIHVLCLSGAETATDVRQFG